MNKPRIQDDLYNYVNCEKLEQLVIPSDKPCAGGFQEIAEEVEKTMMAEFNEMSESNTYPNEYLQRACALYKAAKDVDKKESKPVHENLF